MPLEGLARLLLGAAEAVADRPAVLGVGGRSSSGKTTLSGRLAAVVPGAVVVHTDDIAWWHSVLDWEHLLAGGVLKPALRGPPVSYRPPGWDERGRSGSIVVPAGTRVLIVEGVGATRRGLAPLLDATVWMQADEIELERRNEARVAAGEITPSNHRVDGRGEPVPARRPGLGAGNRRGGPNPRAAARPPDRGRRRSPADPALTLLSSAGRRRGRRVDVDSWPMCGCRPHRMCRESARCMDAGMTDFLRIRTDQWRVGR